MSSGEWGREGEGGGGRRGGWAGGMLRDQEGEVSGHPVGIVRTLETMLIEMLCFYVKSHLFLVITFIFKV